MKCGEEECLELVFSDLDMIVEKSVENPERRQENSTNEMTLGRLDDPHGLQDCIIRAAKEAKHSKK